LYVFEIQELLVGIDITQTCRLVFIPSFLFLACGCTVIYSTWCWA